MHHATAEFEHILQALDPIEAKLDSYAHVQIKEWFVLDAGTGTIQQLGRQVFVVFD